MSVQRPRARSCRSWIVGVRERMCFLAPPVATMLALVWAAGVGGCDSGPSHADPRANADEPRAVTPAGPGSAAAPPAGGSAISVTEIVPPKISTDPIVSQSLHPSGVKIEDLRIGTGATLLPGGTMLFRHRGFVQADGSCFEDSYKSENPVQLTWSQAPKRLQSGMPGMRVGGIRRLIVPASLAFAERGIPKESGEGFVVPPNSTVVYEIELVELRQRLPGDAPASAPASTPAAPAAPTVPAAEAGGNK